MIKRVRRSRVAGQRITAMSDGTLALAVTLAMLAMLELGARGDTPSVDLSTELLLALCATTPIALVAWLRRIIAAAPITLANVVTLAADLEPTLAALAAQLIVTYLLGRAHSRRLSFPVMVPFGLYAVAVPEPGNLALSALVTAAVLLGNAHRERQEAKARKGSSQAIADSLLEHAARGERARIARELHDVVAHHISLIAVQAETARLTTPGLPPDGARRLIAIGDTARAALTEMRRLLGVLREDAGSAPTRAPQPGLVQLNELIDDARDSAGVSTRLIVRGQVGPLDPGVELTAYRIVQEALTNARRHAPGAAVDVELHYTGEALWLTVRDNGPGPPDGAPDGGGHGLLGMRERATAVGGTLTAGPGPLGGFRIQAVLPTGSVS